MVRKPVVVAAVMAALVLGGVFLAARSGPFDPPLAYPGQVWVKDGKLVSPLIVDVAGGPAHCGWQSAAFLTLGWPLGTSAAFAIQARQYVRDPGGVTQNAKLRSRFDLSARLPADARPTGFLEGGTQLYLAPSDEDIAAYVVYSGHVERWPRSNPMTVCS
jgi:hypothetical protein